MGSYKSPFSLAKKASEIGFKDNNLFVLSGGGFDYNERFTIAHQTSSGKIETIQVPNSNMVK